MKQLFFKKIFSLILLQICINQNLLAKYEIVPAHQSSFKAVIFDMGEVLVTTSTKSKALLFLPKSISEISIFYTLLSYNIQVELFKALNEVPAQTSPSIKMYNKNKQMAQIMVDWMVIPNSSHKICQQAIKQIAQSNRSDQMKKVLIKVVQFMFDPEKFIESQIIIKPMQELAEKLKENGYKLYILSNWANDSFPLLKRRYPKLFQLFDGIMISGEEALGKPHSDFYQRLLMKYHLAAEECIFIDDEPHNIEAAKALGVTSITHDSNKSVLLQLKKIGIIK